jgi:signal transduction histidine kinase
VLADRERLLSWWDGKPRSLLLDLAVALLLVVWPDDRSPWLLGALVVAGCGLLVRRRFPELALAASLPAAVLGPQPLPVAIALYTLARRRGPGRSLWIAGTSGIVVLVAAEMLRQPGWHGFPILLGIAVKSATYGAPVMLGLWLHQRQVLLAAARERIERAERERALRAERAVAEERRRIARELHDVIAHRASVMTLQAGALTVHAPDDATAGSAEVIRENSAKALTELRGMLRVLRDGPADRGEAADAPTLRDIETLVRDAVAAGSAVELRMLEEQPETSGTTGRAAYRVVQEALTNAARHAQGAEVLVEVAADEQLTVHIANEPTERTAGVAGSGYGLLGMRERVALAGGSLHAGPTGDGGYRVTAVLPLTESRTGR